MSAPSEEHEGGESQGNQLRWWHVVGTLLVVVVLVYASAALVGWIYGEGDDADGGASINLGESGELASITFAPGWLPEGLSLSGGCLREAGGKAGATILGYRGDGRYKSETEPIRVESAFLRIFGADFDAGVEFDDASFSVEDILDEAKPGTLTPTTVRGTSAQVFLIASGEEPSAWPAVVWSVGPQLFWIIGEGLDEATVLRVANSLEVIPLDEFRSSANNEQC